MGKSGKLIAFGLILAVISVGLYLFVIRLDKVRNEIADKQEALDHIKIIYMGVHYYAQDHHATFPPMKDTQDFQNAVGPYVADYNIASVFIDPVSKAPYAVNRKCSGIDERRISNPTALIIVYQPKPAPDGSRLVMFADGHIKKESPAEWAEAIENPGHKGTPTAHSEEKPTLIPVLKQHRS